MKRFNKEPGARISSACFVVMRGRKGCGIVLRDPIALVTLGIIWGGGAGMEIILSLERWGNRACMGISCHIACRVWGSIFLVKGRMGLVR